MRLLINNLSAFLFLILLSNNKYAENLQKVATKSELDKEEFWNGEYEGCYTYKPL